MPRIGMERLSDTLEFRAGARKRVNLPRTDVLHRIILKLAYNVEVTGGSGAGAPFADGYARLFPDIRVLAGKVPVQAVTGQALAKLAKFWENAEFVQVNPADDGAGEDHDGEAWLALPFYMPYSLNPHSHAFPASALGVVPVLEVAFGDAADLFTAAADGAFAFAGDELVSVYVEPLEGPDVEKYGRAAAAKYPPLIFNYYERQVVGSGDLRIVLDNVVPGEEIRALLVESFAGGSGGALYAYNDAVIEELRFEMDDVDRYGVVDWDAIQQRNVQAYGLSARETGTVLIDASENKLTGAGQLWGRTHQSTDPVLHIKAAKQTGDNLVRVTTVTTRRGGAPAGNGRRS